MNIFLVGFRKGFTAFGHRVNDVITFLVLVPVYFIGVGITSIIGRLAKKKFLDINPSGDTYWINVDEKEDTLDDYRRSF